MVEIEHFKGSPSDDVMKNQSLSLSERDGSDIDFKNGL